MPGPGGPRGPRGFGPRGFMGGRLGPENVGSNYFRPGGPNRPAPGGYVDTNAYGANIVERAVIKYIDIKNNVKTFVKKKGIVGGIITVGRYFTSGSLRYDSFVSKVAFYDKLKSENRLTEIQCKERKMLAARKYYRYLRKIGYLTLDEYNKSMSKYAESINVKYINDVEQQTQGRTR